QQAIRLRPEARFYSDLGKILYHLEKYPEAIKNLETAIETDRDFGEAYLLLGAIYYDNFNNYPKAYAIYKDAYQRHPEDRSIKMNFCEVSLVAQDFALAFTLANEVLKEANVPQDEKFAMKFIAIASLFFQEKSSDALHEVQTFIEEYKAYPAMEQNDWVYKGSKNFIRMNTILSETDKKLLLVMLDLLESPAPDRDQKLKALETSLEEKLKQ